MSGEEWLADCRVRAATDLFTHRWDPVVLAGLMAGPLRRGRLRAAIGGLSDKVLAESLRRLAHNGLIERDGSPPRVEYRLSALGQSLVDGPLLAFADWIDEHGDELLAAQSRSSETG
ncbi:helix-turn-helix domain-containing protein [Actinokineospora auranticolor]|nr:helix-turn-helix domain-containing protein [Actinokineospora auranticolor]